MRRGSEAVACGCRNFIAFSDNLPTVDLIEASPRMVLSAYAMPGADTAGSAIGLHARAWRCAVAPWHVLCPVRYRRSVSRYLSGACDVGADAYCVADIECRLMRGVLRWGINQCGQH
eukprot:1493943-Rhodomonas_salina.2